MIRKAVERDIDAVETLFEEIHEAEANGLCTTGWVRGVYPVRKTAEDSVRRGDLFVLDEDGEILGAAIINQIQVDIYEKGAWRYPAEDHEVMVMHTLVISPDHWNKGYGKQFFRFYEEYAATHGCTVLRIDTNSINMDARAIYGSLGYREVGIEPCNLFGIENVRLLMLEKKVIVTDC